MRRSLLGALPALCLAACASVVGAAELPRPDAADLYAERDLLGVALAPSGRSVAELRRDGDDDVIRVRRLPDGEGREIVRIPHSGLAPGAATLLAGLRWHAEDRLGFRLQIASEVGLEERQLTVRSDGSGLQVLPNRRLAGRPLPDAVADASPPSRANAPQAAPRAPDFDVAVGYRDLGQGPVAGRRFVLARAPGHDRIGLYLFDEAAGDFGEPLAEDPRFDLSAARIAADGSRALYWCHVADVQVCRFADESVDAGMSRLRAELGAATNLEPVDVSADGRTLVLRVDGPARPPGYYVYDGVARRLEFLGLERAALEGKALPSAEVVRWRSRDGVELTGYLTLPHRAADDAALPLVVYPHGGPEARDALGFDGFVQYFAARGYAVLQPNFRGSEGYGRRFIESGYGQWGLRMQDDLTDAVNALVRKGRVDAGRVCIVGASYGGYAALAGATLTPEVWRCAVSIAGISDLPEFLQWRRRRAGSDSDAYAYWRRVIGDPRRRAAKLAATSPARHADRVRAPVLLIHGDRDEVVPLAQSERMRAALERAGREPEWLVLPGQGHSSWSPSASRRALEAIGDFLWRELGPGAGVAIPPSS